MFSCFLSVFVSVQVSDAHVNILFIIVFFSLNLLVPNDYSDRTAPPTSKRCILYIQQIQVLNILNMVYTLRFFLFKMQFVS